MPTMQRSMAVLEVADVERSAAFYNDKLGFSPGPFFGEPPAFCIVGRDTVTIALDRSRDVGRAPQNHCWAAYVYVDEVDALAEELRGKGVEIIRGPVDQPYGCREIDVQDPDGHIIGFGQDLQPPAAGPGL